nr:DNA (cytosine-5-)-methyltransferase [Mycoplasmopsis caviae]
MRWFPCQAFSKAGKQEGINDTRGTLFFEIERILRNKHTKYILLENVRNLVSHDNGYTWSTIQKILKEIGYRLTSEPLVLSPHQFKIPQIRERVYILGKYDPENVDKPLKIHLKKLFSKKENSIEDILEMNADSEYKISKYEEEILNAWDEFYKGIDVKIIGFPIWTEYFKNNENIEIYPEWKKLIIRKNIDLYQRNKTFIDKWLKKYNNLESFAPTHRKFEWQAGTNIQSLWEGIIQLRPSGIRVKKPDCFQALVAIVQIPIIGKYKRRLTIRECARLQSFPESFIPSKNKLQAYKQFGNSVNVEIIKFLFDELIKN